MEDVITTGKSSLECSKLIENAEANIIGYACIIDRTNNQSLLKKKIISQIKLVIPTYDKENLPKELLMIKAVKPGSRDLK
jgi:orotate phosphoribosyltransferase